MKLLAIIGTPTREAGYTTKTVAALEQSLQALADVTVEYLYLDALNLGRCQGHLTCVKYGEAQCPFYSDVHALQTAMEQADGIIFASPVHCFNVSTLMKNLIDLLVYQMHRPSFFGKKAVVVTSAAGAGHKTVLKYLRQTASTWGFDVVGQLGTHSGLFDEDAYQPKLRKATDKVARQFLTAIERADVPAPGLSQLIGFRVWRSVILRTREASPYDWQHWQASGWLEQDYYFPVRPNPAARLIAGLIERMINRAIRTVSVKPVT